MDYDAIHRAYPNVAQITIDGDILDIDGNSVSISQSNVDAARTAINNELYKTNRVTGTATTAGYPALGEQLDLLYHDMKAGKLGVAATTGNWYVGITSVKMNFPKSS